MNIKLIVTDLDNTLLRNDKSISDYTTAIFRKCPDYGIKTSVATARYITGITPFTDRIRPDYQITNDGTMTFCNGKLLFGFYMDTELSNEILNMIKKENPGCYISIVNDNGIFRQYPADRQVTLTGCESPSYTVTFNEPLKLPTFKIVMECSSPELAEEICRKFDCRYLSYRNENRYAFMAKNAGKAGALKKLAEVTGIPTGHIAAFGDDTNDLDMMKLCGVSVAVSNAIADIKDIATHTTDSNENDGVAKFIEKYLF